MITLKQFLVEGGLTIFTNEEYEENKDEVLDKIIERIKSDCKPWIQEFGGLVPLYRGIISNTPFFSRQYVRQDRKPRDSGREIHKKWDNFFKKEFGHPFRSASVFASTNYNDASDYGDVFLIFPTQTYSYVFSPYVSDLTESFNVSLQNFNNQNRGEDNYTSNNVPQDVVNDIMGDFTYEMDFGLDEFLKRRVEVMIKCESYYALECLTNAETSFILNRFKEAS